MHDRKINPEPSYDDVQFLHKRVTDLELENARLDHNWKSGKPYPYRQAPNKLKYSSCCMQPRVLLPSIKMAQCATCGKRFPLNDPINIQHQRG